MSAHCKVGREQEQVPSLSSIGTIISIAKPGAERRLSSPTLGIMNKWRAFPRPLKRGGAIAVLTISPNQAPIP